MVDRLSRAGATPEEITQLQVSHPSLGQRLETMADQDIHEFLEHLRFGGHFGPQVITPDAQIAEGDGVEKVGIEAKPDGGEHVLEPDGAGDGEDAGMADTGKAGGK